MLLFRAKAEFPGYGSYDTLFFSNLKQKAITQLTFFPEKVMLLNNKSILQFQNRFGIFRTDSGLTNIKAVKIFPAFVHGYEIESGKISPVKASPDGNYIIYFKPTTPAFGNLMLYDFENNKEWLVSEKIELTLSSPPVEWSTDSRYFVYSKAYKIYYYSIEQLRKNRVIAENYRNIAEGTISNIHWDNFGSLYYIYDTLVYKLVGSEFFTRALYINFLKLGTIVGRIPFPFESNFDSFYISPDGKKILLNKGGKNIFLYLLKNEDTHITDSITNLPYLYLPRDALITKILWSIDDYITLLAERMEKGKIKTSIYRIAVPIEDENKAFAELNVGEVKDIALADDGKKIALMKANSIDIYDYKKWNKIHEITHPGVLQVLWKSDSELIIAGAQLTELYNMTTGARQFITLSQPGAFGFSEDYKNILTKIDNGIYTVPIERISWQAAGEFKIADNETAGEDFRVYIEDIERGNYANMVMVRDLKGLTTLTLFPFKEYIYETYPEKETPIDFNYFNHGSRIRRREVALVFNAIDSTEGLTAVLKVLSDYRIRCTFFVNGEFIRRYPDAVKEIAESGHEVGSLFYAYFNMTDARFNIDEDFIKKGLARNEDEYYLATGKELSILWHAPYYFISSEIIKASKAMNYSYIGRDIDSLDWVSKNEKNISTGIYFTAGLLVERILKLKKPGSIIPIRLGRLTGERDDYLFHRVDVIINALLKLGYKIVTVSTLMEHAK
ncbi:MAG: polysaccharide deacetylase family protein [Spirochaetales bacterium]|nr:polysaccharide deacetylase family protein [Spirochaetales bacterium]